MTIPVTNQWQPILKEATETESYHQLKEFLKECKDFNVNIYGGTQKILEHNFRYNQYICESFNGYEFTLIWNDSFQAYILSKYKRLPFNRTNSDRYYVSWEK